METLAYLYVIEEQNVIEQRNTVTVDRFERNRNALMLQDFQIDERCELIEAEVDALEQSVVWMMP